MRYLFFTNTPAHVHLYKYAIERLEQLGHEVSVLARDYGCTVDLLEWHDLPYTVYGSCGTTKGSLARRLPGHYARILVETLRYNPDLIFGMGGYAAPAGMVSRTPVILILDSEPTSLDHALSTPVARSVLTPAAFKKSLGTDHYVFDGFKESAYLHPAVYEPDVNIRRRLGISDDERYAIVRLNAFGSHHDVGMGGFTPEQRTELITDLSEQVTVFVSDEGDTLDVATLPAKPFDIHPAELHAALSQASLLVADTQTIVTEAALLGTPAIRSNSFVGAEDMGNFLELEARDLIFNFADFEDVRRKARELLADPATESVWEQRCDQYVADMVNLTDVIVDVATNPSSVEDVNALTPWTEMRSSNSDRSQHAERLRTRLSRE